MSEAKMAVPFVTSLPDPEVPAKAQRRKFQRGRQEAVLEDVERATGHSGIGAVLRREGMYSSTLYSWRKERDAAVREAFLRSEVRGHSAIGSARGKRKAASPDQRSRKSGESPHSNRHSKKSGQLIGHPIAEVPDGEKWS